MTEPDIEITTAWDEQVEAARMEAFKLEESIVRRCRAMRASWVDLAADLYAFHDGRAWTLLGYENLDQWLAQPDVEMSRSTFFELVETYRELHVDRAITHEALRAVDSSKLQTVLPAIRREQIDAATALGDCEALTRTDLREKYRAIGPAAPAGAGHKPIEPDDFHYENCPTCGSRMRVKG